MMMLSLRNQFLKNIEALPDFEILPEETKKQRLKKIMDDVDLSRLFEFKDIEDELADIDAIADIYFNPELSQAEKDRMIASQHRDRYESQTQDGFNSQYSSIMEERILQKQRELGIEPDKTVSESSATGKRLLYGRSPLHECIAQRCIEQVREMAEKGLYLYDRDGNENTPLQMAQLEDYKEAVTILRKAMKDYK